MPKNYVCKTCKLDCGSLGGIMEHYQQNPDHKRKYTPRKPKIVVVDPIEKFKLAQAMAKEAVADIDFRRQELHSKLRELDDMAAAAKKLIG